MPTFTGNLKDLGLDPRPGLVPYMKFTVERMGVSSSGQAVGGSTEAVIDSSGAVTVTLASTVGLLPPTRVKMTGGWLGEDSFFDLPPFQVPEQNGTIADLVALTDIPTAGIWGRGFGPPPDWFNGFAWFDLSGDTVRLYSREF